jgi:hypothetical protein
MELNIQQKKRFKFGFAKRFLWVHELPFKHRFLDLACGSQRGVGDEFP